MKSRYTEDVVLSLFRQLEDEGDRAEIIGELRALIEIAKRRSVNTQRRPVRCEVIGFPTAGRAAL